MSTRSNKTSSRPEKKASSETLPNQSIAQSVSSSLLLIMRFLDDACSTARMHAVCRNWRNLSTSQLDLVWKTLYHRDWEAESASDVMVDGESTSWKRRYERRKRVERN